MGDDEDITMPELDCMYDGCEEQFQSHKERLTHSLKEHTDVNHKKYPHLTGSDSGLKF